MLKSFQLSDLLARRRTPGFVSVQKSVLLPHVVLMVLALSRVDARSLDVEPLLRACQRLNATGCWSAFTGWLARAPKATAGA